MKRAVKTVLSRNLPGIYLRVQARRARAASQRFERDQGCPELTRKLVDRLGACVQSGPLRGLEFPRQVLDRHLAPKLLGAYELELHPALEAVIGGAHAELLNIGCAEGYYAVGLARRLPRTRVHAFDLDPWARRMTRRMAQANATPGVRVHGACSQAWLRRHIRPNSFILSDCEGCEDALFRLDLVPQLASCDLVIELHEAEAPGVTERLRGRFGETHSATLIQAVPRSPSDYPVLSELPRRERFLAVDEFRPAGQEWLLLKAGERRPARPSGSQRAR